MAVIDDFIYEYTRLINNLKAINDAEFESKVNRDEKGRFAKKQSNAPQNIDISVLKPISFSWDEYNKYKDKEKVKKYYKDNIQGSYITHKSLGNIRFIDIGLDETFRQNRRKNYYILTKIDEIIKNSLYDRTEPPNHIRKKDNISKFHILYSKISLPTKEQTLLINVAEDNQGKKYYYYKPIETIRVIS